MANEKFRVCRVLRHDFHDGLGFSCVYIMLFGDLFYDSLS